MNRFSKNIIVSRNLDGFSLANQGWFAKFAKLSHYTVFLHKQNTTLWWYVFNRNVSICHSTITTLHSIMNHGSGP